MTPAEQEVLREIGAYLGSLAEDLAECAQGTAETATLIETVAGSLSRIEDALEALTGKVRQLYDKQEQTDERLRLYLQDASQAESGMRQLRSEVRKVDERLKGLGG